MYSKEYVESIDGVNFPGTSFAECVLEHVFNIQKNYFYRPFIKISKAHAVMLLEQNIITYDEAKTILRGLGEVEKINFEQSKYDPSYEDMFFMVEKALSDLIGVDAAGRLHIARSRNDLDICEFRMVLREKILNVMEWVNNFREVLLSMAEENLDTIMPAYTHTQPAQPTTLAHYLLAFYDSLERDYLRLRGTYSTINKSPIGAAAITTTGFPINRERMAELLGFNELVENSYDCIAGTDYLMECASALMILNTNMSKLMRDTLDFCTKEFNVYYLSDPYVQISSIMPQKRNPSSLEHTRPMISKAIAEAKNVFDILHNTPFGDIVDTEEQLQPHLYDSMEYTTRVLRILSSVFTTLKINKEMLIEKARQGFITATELADTFVREKGLSFRQSHKITSEIVNYISKNHKESKDITSEVIEAIAERITGYKVIILEEEIKTALDPVNFVNVRKVVGGPAPSETNRMLIARRERYDADLENFKLYFLKLKTADETLETLIDTYLANGRSIL
jgi:argininosuccinate lyase